MVASGTGLTVNVAADEVAGLGGHVPLTTQSKPVAEVAASDVVTLVICKLALAVPLYVEPLTVAPSVIFTPFFRHWYVRAVPVAVTEKFAVLPTQTVWAAGCPVIPGA